MSIYPSITCLYPKTITRPPLAPDPVSPNNEISTLLVVIVPYNSFHITFYTSTNRKSIRHLSICNTPKKQERVWRALSLCFFWYSRDLTWSANGGIWGFIFIYHSARRPSLACNFLDGQLSYARLNLGTLDDACIICMDEVRTDKYY